MRFWLVLAIVVLAVGVPTIAGPSAPARAGPPQAAALAPLGLAAASSVGSSPHPSAVPPPPPYDWDPMWFNARNATGVPAVGGDGAQIAVDDPGGLAFLYGGVTQLGGVSNATWMVNQTTAIWDLLSTPVAPGPRVDFSLASGGRCGSAVLFGGVVNTTTHQATNDTWLFNFTTRTWRNVTRPVGPAPRQGAALAVDSVSCQAVLYGGSDQAYASGNSTGSVQWNDTWVLGLANQTWWHDTTRGTPPSVTDAGLVFDNRSHLFLLYGGCDSLCSGTIWDFHLATSTWTARPPSSSVPPGRGGADWVYGYGHDIAVLSMGYTLNGNERSALNDTYVYEIGNNRWDPVGEPAPGPRYDAAGGWFGANGCPGFVIVGGAGAPTNPPDQWILDEAPDIPLQCDTWGNDSISNTGGGGGRGCDFEFYVVVNVTSAATGEPIAGANVTVAGNCSRSSALSDPNGQAAFNIAFAHYDITVRDALYHTNTTPYMPVVGGLVGYVNLSLIALPVLTVATFQRGATGPVSVLGNVTVTAEGDLPLGVTDPVNGTLVVPGFWPLGITEHFVGNRTGWGDGANDSPIPYTGNWSVNLTLLEPGPVDVQVIEDRTGSPLAGAFVTVAAVPTEPPSSFRNTTDLGGWTNGTLPGGNFTAVAHLAGFTPVRDLPAFFHPWAAVTVVRINLTSDNGYTVDVEVLDLSTGHGLPGSSVQIGDYPPQLTDASGWTNRTGIRPGGAYGVAAWHVNYSTNRTEVFLSFQKPVWIVIFGLAPVRDCSAPGANCTRVPQGPAGVAPLSLWPSSLPALSLLAGGGALLFLLPATALILARRRGRSGPPGERER